MSYINNSQRCSLELHLVRTSGMVGISWSSRSLCGNRYVGKTPIKDVYGYQISADCFDDCDFETGLAKGGFVRVYICDKHFALDSRPDLAPRVNGGSWIVHPSSGTVIPEYLGEDWRKYVYISDCEKRSELNPYDNNHEGLRYYLGDAVMSTADERKGVLAWVQGVRSKCTSFKIVE